MALLSLQNVTLNLGGKPLLKNADFNLEVGDRLCLVGRNGAGKSSLLRLLAGELSPDDGLIVRTTAGVHFGYMPQTVPAHWHGPVFGLAAGGLGPEGEGLAFAHMVATGRENALSAAQLLLAHKFLESGDGWERYGDVISVLNHLGLNPETEFTTLSGGSQRRVVLARALLSADHLLLDEPTNHLDIRTIAWLEDFLARRAKTLLFISHDRAFVRKLATRMVELDRGKLQTFDCGYDTFLERRDALLENEEKQAAQFDKKLAQEEVWIRQGIKARRTRNMGRVRALEDMRRERAARRERMGSVNMFAQEAQRSGKLVIEAEGVAFDYPDGYQVLRDFSTVIQRGDRVGLVGNNGVGKTTLLRLLLGDLQPSAGSIRHGTHLEISYFDQHRMELNPNVSVMDSVADGNDTVLINGQPRHVASYLLDFLFEPDRLRIPVHRLSGGERNRLLLARLFTRPSNVLVLDEPTNDLDAETLDLLEELLENYSGTVLLVSHDRVFLDNIVTSTLALEGDGLVREYVGGYTDWLRQRPDPTEKSAEKRPESDAQAPWKSQPVSAKPTKVKLSFKEQRELEELQLFLSHMPGLLVEQEAEQARLEQQLAEPDLFSRDPALFHSVTARLGSLEAEQVALLERWEAAEARISALQPESSAP